MDFENEIEKIFTYLNPEKVKELVDSTNSQTVDKYVKFLLICLLFCKNNKISNINSNV